MMGNTDLAESVKAASVAHCDLNIFYAVIAILEGGTISSDSDKDAQRIIEICRSASQKALRKYDRELAAALRTRKAQP